MSDLKDQVINTRHLRLAANYIDCVRNILKDVYQTLPDEIKTKYSMTELASGEIDIQFPSPSDEA